MQNGMEYNEECIREMEIKAGALHIQSHRNVLNNVDSEVLEAFKNNTKHLDILRGREKRLDSAYPNRVKIKGLYGW